MPNTEHYNLFITDDGQETFQNFRRELAGPDNSNMTKIDNALFEKIDKSKIGQPSGVPSLGEDGLVPPDQLPSHVTSFNGRNGAVMPQTGDYTAEMVGALSLEKASKYNYKTWLPQNGSKWWKIGEVDLVGSFCIQCIVYESRQSNPNRPDFSVFGLAGDFVQPPISGSLVALIAGTDTLARIVLCNDGTIWGNRNGRYGYFNVSAVRATAATLYDTVEISADNPSGEIVWDSYDNSYVVSTQRRQNVNEYQNPPMTLGVEYRTPEQFNERPVYIKAISLGAGPEANTVKTVSHSISNMRDIVSYGGSMNSGGSQPVSLPGITPDGTDIRQLAVNYSNFLWKAGKDSISNYTGTAWVRYTKTTD